MRHLCLIALVSLTLQTGYSQTVTIRNVSYPGTGLEVGNTVEIKITGASPFGTVTVVENGNPPFTFGTTNIFGIFTITAVETTPYIGSYSQQWYVNGTAMTPINPDIVYFPFAPRLPFFQVSANYTGTNSAPQSTQVAGCGASGNALHVAWSPVTYGSSSTLAPAIINGAATAWIRAQSKLTLSNNTTARFDISLIDDAGIGGYTYGSNSSYGQDCSPCLNRTNLCTGQCIRKEQVYGSQIKLNQPAMANLASALVAPINDITSMVTIHELGHALRLGHSQVYNGICSEVQSIMYPDEGILYTCGVRGPTASDTSSFNAIYPSVVPFCAVTTTPACILPSPAC